jgi:molecular chaperone DnaK
MVAFFILGRSGPAIPPAVLEIDDVHTALVADEGAERPADQADEEGAENGGPEAAHLEAGDHPRGHLEHQGVDHEGEQAQQGGAAGAEASQAGAEQASAAEDNVVDAEFEEVKENKK